MTPQRSLPADTGAFLPNDGTTNQGDDVRHEVRMSDDSGTHTPGGEETAQSRLAAIVCTAYAKSGDELRARRKWQGTPTPRQFRQYTYSPPQPAERDPLADRQPHSSCERCKFGGFLLHEKSCPCRHVLQDVYVCDYCLYTATTKKRIKAHLVLCWAQSVYPWLTKKNVESADTREPRGQFAHLFDCDVRGCKFVTHMPQILQAHRPVCALQSLTSPGDKRFPRLPERGDWERLHENDWCVPEAFRVHIDEVVDFLHTDLADEALRDWQPGAPKLSLPEAPPPFWMDPTEPLGRPERHRKPKVAVPEPQKKVPSKQEKRPAPDDGNKAPSKRASPDGLTDTDQDGTTELRVSSPSPDRSADDVDTDGAATEAGGFTEVTHRRSGSHVRYLEKKSKSREPSEERRGAGSKRGKTSSSRRPSRGGARGGRGRASPAPTTRSDDPPERWRQPNRRYGHSGRYNTSWSRSDTRSGRNHYVVRGLSPRSDSGRGDETPKSRYAPVHSVQPAPPSSRPDRRDDWPTPGDHGRLREEQARSRRNDASEKRNSDPPRRNDTPKKKKRPSKPPGRKMPFGEPAPTPETVVLVQAPSEAAPEGDGDGSSILSSPVFAQALNLNAPTENRSPPPPPPAPPAPPARSGNPVVTYEGTLVNLRTWENKCVVTIIGELMPGASAISVDGVKYPAYYVGPTSTETVAMMEGKYTVCAHLLRATPPKAMAGALYVGLDTSNFRVVHLAGKNNTKAIMTSRTLCPCADRRAAGQLG